MASESKERRKRKENGNPSSPSPVEFTPPTPLETNITVDHETLPSPPHTAAILAQTPRAVLPVRLGKLQLLKYQFDQDPVLFCTPRLAVHLHDKVIVVDF